MANYDVWTVKQFLEHELEAVRELNEKQPNKMYEVVIEYNGIIINKKIIKS